MIDFLLGNSRAYKELVKRRFRSGVSSKKEVENKKIEGRAGPKSNSIMEIT
jgi:hypothetical protein